MGPFTKQGVRNLDLIGPRSSRNKRAANPKPELCEHHFEWKEGVQYVDEYGMQEMTLAWQECAKCGWRI